MFLFDIYWINDWITINIYTVTYQIWSLIEFLFKYNKKYFQHQRTQKKLLCLAYQFFAPNIVSIPIHNNEYSCHTRWMPYIGGSEGRGICVNWEWHVLIYSSSCTTPIVNFHLFKITMDKPIYRVLRLFKECNSMTFQWPITYFPWPMQL